MTLPDEIMGRIEADFRAKGRSTGYEEGQRDLLRSMLVQRFGDLEHSVLERLFAATGDELSRMASRVLTATTLDELFTEERATSIGRRLFDKARSEGHVCGKRALIRALVEQRFGPLPESVSAQLDAANLGELQRWAHRLVTAATLDDVFADQV